MESLRVWATACSHVHSDLKEGRRSIAEAIEQSEFDGADGGPPFDWDIMLHLGDISGTQTPPTDADGPRVVEQLTSGKKHRIEQIYQLIGNHDASGPGEETQWWFRKWVDPEGINPQHSQVRSERRPFAIEGDWERNSFVAGNILFLIMSDRNDGGPPKGRSDHGGWPAGAMTRHHAKNKRPLFPLSRLLTFTAGSRELRIQCYLHTTDYAAQGWYAPAERTLILSKPFRP